MEQPSSAGPGTQHFPFTSPRHERIYRRLRLLGEGPADFYRDACRLINDPHLRTTTHMVAHALRETESAIRRVLLPEDYVPPPQCSVCGVRPEAHKAQIAAILKAYGIVDSDPAAIAWLRVPRRGDAKGLHGLAHRDALEGARPPDEDFRTFWNEIESLFDAILEKFETRFTDFFRLVDELIAKPVPVRDDVRILRNRVPNNAITLEHFFTKVEHPAWLGLLAAGDFFRYPPEPIVDEEQGGVRLVPWPASRYLVRMALVPPLQTRVAEIALAIPETTNQIVNDDLMKIALALPPDLAIQFADKAKTWAVSPYQLIHTEQFGLFAVKLASAGNVDSALDFMRSLLTPAPDPRYTKSPSGEPAIRMSPEPKAPFNEWGYGQILKKHIPVLVDAGGIKTVRMLCELLAEAIRLSRTATSADDVEDYSHIWRPAIEDHEQNRNRGQDLKDMLVSAVRDAADRLAQRDSPLVPEIVATLEQQRWNVFRRIALHVLRLSTTSAGDLVGKRLTDHALFEESDLWHEYTLLLRENFPTLPPSQQAAILGWIEAGPDVSDFKRTGTPPSEEDEGRYIDNWQLRQLSRFEAGLPPEWQARRDALAARLGQVEHPDLTSYSMGVFVGPTSPKTEAELREMTVSDIVAYLRSWKAPGAFMGPSPEGLGRHLAAIVAADPGRFASEASRFRELDPTYVRALVGSLRDAVKAGKAFPWAPALDLCQWVVDQGPDAGGRRKPKSVDDEDRDPGWGWTRQAIAYLLEAGFQQGPLEIPIDLRSAVWRVLRPLTGDPDPTPEHEAEYGGTNMNPSELSINTTRGEAMHAVVGYALWVRRYLETLPGKAERVARGFDEIPEVREVLDERLDVAVDPSSTIRSVYGRHFPWLGLLDRDWAKGNVSYIFPQDPALNRLRETAWDTYVTFCRPYNDVLPLLRDEYLHAIDRIGRDRATRHMANPDESLAEHLMVYYWLGKIDLDGPELTRFFDTAPDGLRAHALSFVGNVFHNDQSEIPKEALDRVKTLWATRFDIAKTAPAAHTRELEAFGWWFATSHFDEPWRIAELTKVLSLIRCVEPDHIVLEQLADLSSRLPAPAVESLRLLIDGAKESWTITTWNQHIRTILANGLRAEDAKTQAAARAVVNILVARGYPDFRDLLADSTTS
jgi:hypothetical protein